MLEFFRNIFRKLRRESVIRSVKDGADTLSIVENKDELTLKINNVVYSRLNKKSLYTGSYWDYFTPLPALYENPKIAMIGLGGGTIPYQMVHLYKKINMDVLEISKPMVELSKAFLHGKLEDINIITEDGSEYIKRYKGKYDILVLDAYERDHIPDVFLKEEFANDAFNVLKDEGVMAINYALNLSALVYLERYISKLRKLFKVYTINSPLTSGNMIILCSKTFDRDQILQKIRSGFEENGDNRNMLLAYKNMDSA